MRRFRQRFALDEIASGIVLWMEAVGIKQAHLVGHSMGGYICLWIAAHHPERLQCLVLVSPAGIPHIRSLHGYALPLLVTIHSLKPSFFYFLISDALRAGPLTIVRVAQELLTKDIRECLKDITAPTLLIWGEYDSLVPLMLGDILKQEIRHAHLLILKKAGHVSMFDQPKQFNAAVLTFFADHAINLRTATGRSMPVAVAHRSLFSPLVVTQQLVWHLYEHQSARQCLYSM